MQVSAYRCNCHQAVQLSSQPTRSNHPVCLDTLLLYCALWARVFPFATGCTSRSLHLQPPLILHRATHDLEVLVNAYTTELHSAIYTCRSRRVHIHVHIIPTRFSSRPESERVQHTSGVVASRIVSRECTTYESIAKSETTTEEREFPHR